MSVKQAPCLVVKMTNSTGEIMFRLVTTPVLAGEILFFLSTLEKSGWFMLQSHMFWFTKKTMGKP